MNTIYISLHDVHKVVGGIDILEYATKIYKIKFNDRTPPAHFNALKHLASGASHPMVDLMMARTILEHWEDYNIPPIPTEGATL